MSIGRRAFWIVWSLLLVLALVVPISTAAYFDGYDDRRRHAPFNDLGLRGSNDGARLLQPHGATARAQGVVDGAVIVSVNGQPVSRGIDRADLASMLNVPSGNFVSLVTRTPSGELRSHRLERVPGQISRSFAGTGLSPQLRDRLFLIIMLGSAAVAVSAALLLALRRPRDKVALIFSTALLMQANGAGTASFWFSLDIVLVGASLYFFGLALTGIGFLLFPDGGRRPRWMYAFASILVLWMAIRVADVRLQIISPSVENNVFVVLLVISAGQLLVRFRRFDAAQMQQIRWALLGFIAATTCYLIATLVGTFIIDGSTDEYQRVWGYLITGSASTLSLILLSGGLIVSILRYRLYDAEAVISRSASVAVLTLAMAAIFAGASKAIELLVEERFGDAGAYPAVAAAALAVLLFLPLNNRIQTWAERRFHGRLASLRHHLPERVGDLREVANSGTLLGETLDEIIAAVRARHAAAIVGRDVRQLRGIGEEQVRAWFASVSLGSITGKTTDPDDSLFPLRLPLIDHQGQTLGAILLGPRPDGSFYGSDEREVLADITAPISRALDIVLQREQQRVEIEARLQRLESFIERRLRPKRLAATTP